MTRPDLREVFHARRPLPTDRWLIRYHPDLRAWSAKPRPTGVWAGTVSERMYFRTLAAAADYARRRIQHLALGAQLERRARATAGAAQGFIDAAQARRGGLR